MVFVNGPPHRAVFLGILPRPVYNHRNPLPHDRSRAQQQLVQLVWTRSAVDAELRCHLQQRSQHTCATVNSSCETNCCSAFAADRRRSDTSGAETRLQDFGAQRRQNCLGDRGMWLIAFTGESRRTRSSRRVVAESHLRIAGTPDEVSARKVVISSRWPSLPADRAEFDERRPTQRPRASVVEIQVIARWPSSVADAATDAGTSGGSRQRICDD